MRSYFGTIGFASNALDAKTETHRPATSQDLVDIFRLSDVLEPPHFMLTPGTPSDVPAELSDLYEGSSKRKRKFGQDHPNGE
jgi:hypothetical protein